MADEKCTCSIDDFGMGHGDGCPVGERNARRSIRDMLERLAGYGVPEAALKPLRGWLVLQEKLAEQKRNPHAT